MMKHLINIADLSQKDIITIFDKTKEYIQFDSSTKKVSYKKSLLLKDKTIFNLFFEPSTRTRTTFELAAKNLGANVININLDHSSIKKGESLKDTILTIKSMQADCIVVRHKESGIAQSIADLCGDNTIVINAGDGSNAHPTQALLDVYTIAQHKPEISKLKVAIIGDILHSRVARSQIMALKKLGCKNINVIGPKILLPESLDYLKDLQVFQDLKNGIKDVDVISSLRLQKERMQHTLILDEHDYFDNYGITEDILKLAKQDAIVIHPGPINRDIEISSEVADGPQSVILEQVTNGVAVRMAIYDLLLGQ